MLIDEVRKIREIRPQDIVSLKGACECCGQIKIVEAPVNWNDDQVNGLVTEMCDCIEADHRTRLKRQKERAHAKIEELFNGNDKENECINNAALQLIHNAVEPIVDDDIASATIDIGGIKAKLSMTAKGNVKITRTDTKTKNYEA